MSADLMRRAGYLLMQTNVPVPDEARFILAVLLSSGTPTTARVELAQAIVDASQDADR